MITLTQFWTVLSALASILPAVISAVREGRIKGEGQDEALAALLEIHSARVAAAKATYKPLAPGQKSKYEV